MSKVVCKRRKSQKTCLTSDQCKWENDKCDTTTSEVTAPVEDKPKVKCNLRKSQKSCITSDQCVWDSDKCVFKTITKQESPDLDQKKLLALPNKHCKYTAKKDHVFDRHVRLDDPNYKEIYDANYKSDNMHIGQRKLLVSEIQLLNAYYSTKPKKDPTILYIGSAPGTHLLVLTKLFPNVKFILYDGAKFDTKLSKNHKFELHNEFFDDNKAKEYTDHDMPLLFVSDIRLTEEKFEAGVVRDMKMQEDWVRIIDPVMSLLKFRMSYDMKAGDKIKYLKGTLLFGIWAKPLSGETRLLVKQEDNKKSVNYEFSAYEQTQFFHNKYVRQFCFKSAYNSFKGQMYELDNDYCPCYDCYAELSILADYIKLDSKYIATNILYKAIEIMKPPRFATIKI